MSVISTDSSSDSSSPFPETECKSSPAASAPVKFGNYLEKRLSSRTNMQKKFGLAPETELDLLSKNITDFSSCDYLSCARDLSISKLLEKDIHEWNNCGNKNCGIGGAGLARLMVARPYGIGKNSIKNSAMKILFDVENYIANVFNSESAVVFKSGFNANVSFFEIICKPQDCIIIDELCHKSIRNGCKLSQCKNILQFKHSNVNDLSKKLEQVYAKQKKQSMMDSNLENNKDGKQPKPKLQDGIILIGMESIYSMDGDIGPVEEILKLISKYDNCYLFVDEAHAGGVIGNKSNGYGGTIDMEKLKEQLGVDVSQRLIRLITFSKAHGASGATILCNRIIKEFLHFNARSLNYSHVITPMILLTIKRYLIHNIESKQVQLRRNQLKENVFYFKKQLKSILNLETISNSQVQYIMIYDSIKARKLQDYLATYNIVLGAVPYPIVPKGFERMRVLIHAHNTKQQIDTMLNLVKKFLDGYQ